MYSKYTHFVIIHSMTQCKHTVKYITIAHILIIGCGLASLEAVWDWWVWCDHWVWFLEASLDVVFRVSLGEVLWALLDVVFITS